MRGIIGMIVVVFSMNVFAGKEHEHKPAAVSPNFEKMKVLVGTWEGKTKMNGKEENLKVIYSLTSGGTAIIETMNPGTPGEMVTVYANNGNTVNATHFCMEGNQPQMALKSANGKTFAFEMIGTNGIANKNDSHMHAVALTIDGNKLKQDWTNFKEGKKSEVVSFTLTKKI